MADDNKASLTLDEVVQRFADSEQALRQIGERLQHIVEVDERGAQSLNAIEEAAGLVRGFVDSVSAATTELVESQRLSQDAIRQAAAYLDGSQLQEIESDISELKANIAESRSYIDHQVRDVKEAVGRTANLQQQILNHLRDQESTLETLVKKRKRFLIF